MTLLAWVARILLLLLAVRFLVRLFTGGRRSRTGVAGPRPRVRIGGTLVRDPQCGTYVPRDQAVTIGSGDSAECFCSARCRDAYLAAAAPRTGTG